MPSVKSVELYGWSLPQDWSVEPLAEDPSCVVIGCAKLGWVTVDMQSRCFSLGIGKPRRKPGGWKKYEVSGRNWRRNLLTAAETHLTIASMKKSGTSAPWLEGLIRTLMHEGVNKHRAREIAQGYWNFYCRDDLEQREAALQAADELLENNIQADEWRKQWKHLW